MSRGSTIAHLICGYPARCVELRLNLLATHLLCDVRNAHPKHTDWYRAISRLVIDRQFNLVCLIDIHGKAFVQPFIVSGSLGPGFDRVFNLDDYVCLWPSRKSRTGRMVHVLDRMDAHCQQTRQRLAHVRSTKTLIYTTS